MINQLLSIVDDKLVIEKLRLKYLDGNTIHVGNYDLKGQLNVDLHASFKDVNVSGVLKTDTLIVKNLVSDTANKLDAYTFEADSDQGLKNTGLQWRSGEINYAFIFKDEPRSIFSSLTLDLHESASYKIAGATVLSNDRLGSGITRSNLRRVGILDKLEVDGPVNLANVIIVNSELGRIGFNTEVLHRAVTILENSVEVIIGAETNRRAVIGTNTASALDIVTDNTTRISIDGTSVIIGSEKGKNARVKIHGSLEVDNIFSDNRLERSSSLEFVDDGCSILGKGIIWNLKDSSSKSITYHIGPDRFLISESIDLHQNKYYSIDKNLVLSSTELGRTVKHSKLETLGELQSLKVLGDADISGIIKSTSLGVTINGPLILKDGDQLLTLRAGSLGINGDLSLIINNSSEFEIGKNIKLGTRDNTSRLINVYGKLSINTTNPDQDVDLTVPGPVVLNGRKFINGSAVPMFGHWKIGDIVWNATPQEGSYVGWVCTVAGTPGEWKPFGKIG